MKVIKKKISVLGVKYNSKRKWIDINFGSVGINPEFWI